jgi:hypothetical protein
MRAAQGKTMGDELSQKHSNTQRGTRRRNVEIEAIRR